MSYRISLDVTEIAFIQASILRVVRHGQDTMKEQDAINLTTTAALVVTRLNEARLNGRDVMFLNTCIAKARKLMVEDRQINPQQITAMCALCDNLIHKLEGRGVVHNVVTAQ